LKIENLEGLNIEEIFNKNKKWNLIYLEGLKMYLTYKLIIVNGIYTKWCLTISVSL
jgi:hypothetical protein